MQIQMMGNERWLISTEQLTTWLDDKKDVFVVDVRPKDQRDEWHIPGSVHLDAYKRLNKGDSSVLDELKIPGNIPVVAVCAAGRTSMIVAEELRKRGIEAYSLQGGMNEWSLAWNTATMHFGNYEVLQFRRTGKGCLSYMVISQDECLVIDASLPLKAYENVLTERSLKLKFVADTHIHADHLSRSMQLARKFNVPFYLPAQHKVSFTFSPLAPNDVLSIPNVNITALHTPGHTLESSCYLVNDELLFTGDTLFVDGIGRPDLNTTPEESARKATMLYHSLQRLLAFADDTIIMPGHTSSPVEFNNIPINAPISFIRQNVAMLRLSQDDFVKTIVERIPPTPPNFLSIIEANTTGKYEGINAVDMEAGSNRCAIH
jgi:glyoxylase-like metal-dependent hydrolase (beta-lactamase superfamily II)/rhodanese-related sulfurtransferase